MGVLSKNSDWNILLSSASYTDRPLIQGVEVVFRAFTNTFRFLNIADTDECGQWTQELWVECCSFFKLDPENKDPAQEVRLKGVKTTFRIYQVSAD